MPIQRPISRSLSFPLKRNVASYRGESAVYSQNRVAFDGVSYIDGTTELSDASSTKEMTVSLWASMGASTNGSIMDFFYLVDATYGLGPTIFLRRAGTGAGANANKLLFTLNTDTAVIPTQWPSSTTVEADGVVHIALAVRWTDGSETYRMQVTRENEASPYIDMAGTINAGTQGVAYFVPLTGTVTAESLGAGNVGANKFKGTMGDLWIDNSFIDFTSSTQRAKFISTTGAPVDLGSSGQAPTGSSPLIFFGGNMTASTGGPSDTGWNGGYHWGTAGPFV